MRLFNRFAHSAGPGVEDIVGTVLTHLRGKGARRELKNRCPWVQKRKLRGSNFAPRGSNFAPGGLLEPSWGVLGARSPPRTEVVWLGDPFPEDRNCQNPTKVRQCVRFLPSWGAPVGVWGRLGPARLPSEGGWGGSKRPFWAVFLAIWSRASKIHF